MNKETGCDCDHAKRNCDTDIP